MGKIKQGILGGFRGKVGTVIGTTWKGKDVMRGIPQSVKDANTPKQQAQRAFFAEVNALASQLSNAEVRTFFPKAVKGMTPRNLMVRQLAEANTVTDGAKAFDAAKLSTFGNAPGTYDFGAVTVTPVTSESHGGTVLDSLTVSWENTEGEALDNYGAFLVIDSTKGTIHAINSTDKMNVSNTIAALPGWEARDTFKVLPFVYDSPRPHVGFGTLSIVKRPVKRPSTRE